MPLMTQSEYARHIGISPVQITKAKKRGLLDGCWRKKGNKLYIVSTLADKKRAARLDPGYVKGARVTDRVTDIEADSMSDMGDFSIEQGKKGGQDYLTARMWETRYKAAIKKLEYEIKTKKYILRSHVKDANFKAGRIFRDALLNIGPRIAPILAAEIEEGKILEALKAEFNNVLKEMIRMLKKVTGK